MIGANACPVTDIMRVFLLRVALLNDDTGCKNDSNSTPNFRSLVKLLLQIWKVQLTSFLK